MANHDPGAQKDAPQGRGPTRLVLVAAASGVVTGVVGAAFRLSLDQADPLRTALIGWSRQWPSVGWLAPVSIAAALIAAW
jgi:chloride channel protein, CIC family